MSEIRLYIFPVTHDVYLVKKIEKKKKMIFRKIDSETIFKVNNSLIKLFTWFKLSVNCKNGLALR